ncbi:MAG: hypothetical protein ACRDNZ_16195 [Streptosporangiaceae bacterium]
MGSGLAKPPLHVGRLLAGAAGVVRRDVARILGAAIVVTTVVVAAEIVEEHFVNPHSLWQGAVAGVLTEGIGLLGTVFLSGFLCRLTGTARDSREPPVTLRSVITTLPWGRLILADILVVLLVIAGLLALVVPGLIITTLLAIVGPLIEIEDLPVRVALRRSARLVRPYFWRVTLLATIPLLLLSELERAGPEPSGVPGNLEVLAIRGVAEGLLEAAVSLVLIQLCRRLMELAADRPRESPA